MCARTGTAILARSDATATVAVHGCRLMLGDGSVRFAVFGQLKFESFKGVQVNFHVDSPPLILTLNDAVPLNVITGNLSAR